MKYFNIEEREGEFYRWEKLEQAAGFKKILNCTDILYVLEEQLRPAGLQPVVDITGTGIEIIRGSKKFFRRERRYNRSISKRAQEYMAFCEN